MLDGLWEEMHGWLAAEPGLSAQAVLSRLRVLTPDRFKATHLRTVQRAIKAWRAQSARALILNGAGMLTITQPVDLMDDAWASPTAPQVQPPPPPAAMMERAPPSQAATAALPGNIAT
jgi:hypothetical protein